MTNSTILLNSCETDLMELRKDIDQGLYDPEGFTKEADRILGKMNKARAIKQEEQGSQDN